MEKNILVFLFIFTVYVQGAKIKRPYTHQYAKTESKLLSVSKKIPPVEAVKVDKCGIAPLAESHLPDPRIVGGTLVQPPHSYPWQAALLINGDIFCGGTVISNEWILTTAHCLQDAFSVGVILGSYDLYDHGWSQTLYSAIDAIIHENFTRENLHYDIGLARTDRIFFNEYIQPACLPSYSDENLPDGTMVTVTGWGVTSDTNQTISRLLRKVNVPVLAQKDCSDYYGDNDIYDGNLCIDSAGAKGTCNGDSGGPLNYVPVAGGPTYVRGITSFGSTKGCESGAPDAFTKVTYFLKWISEKTGIVINN